MDILLFVIILVTIIGNLIYFYKLKGKITFGTTILALLISSLPFVGQGLALAGIFIWLYEL